MGYQAIPTDSDGNVLVAPTFLKVSESNTVTLADLKVTGYTAPYWETTKKGGQNVGGCTGSKFVIQTLTTAGSKDQSYTWLDYTTSATTKVGPGWFLDGDATPIPGGADSINFSAGKGLWVSGSGLNLIVPAVELDAKKED